MCDTPVIIKRDEVSNSFPCGKCEKCLKRRVSGWSFRLMQQEKISMSAYFLTLTYENEKVPITKNRFMGLEKRHLQLFFKRLREAQDRRGVINGAIKYYAVGEYGSKGWRPHYHVILFNAHLPTLIGDRHAENVERGVIPLDGYYPFQCEQWPNGHVTLGQVNEATVGYTLKYLCKQKRVPQHRNDDRLPEFALMSKRMGRNYITEEIMKWHKADLENRMYLTTPQGVKLAMPRYYKDIIYSHSERSIIAGFQKGEIERRMLESVEKDLLKGDEGYRQILTDKKEAIKASFARMYQNAENGRDKI